MNLKKTAKTAKTENTDLPIIKIPPKISSERKKNILSKFSKMELEEISSTFEIEVKPVQLEWPKISTLIAWDIFLRMDEVPIIENISPELLEKWLDEYSQMTNNDLVELHRKLYKEYSEFRAKYHNPNT